MAVAINQGTALTAQFAFELGLGLEPMLRRETLRTTFPQPNLVAALTYDIIRKIHDALLHNGYALPGSSVPLWKSAG